MIEGHTALALFDHTFRKATASALFDNELRKATALFVAVWHESKNDFKALGNIYLSLWIPQAL